MSCTLAVSVCSAAENVTLYSILAEADPTQIDLLSTINASAVSVVGSATEYIVSEVITQILENDVAGTKTGPIPGRLLTAPVTSICLCCFSSRQSAGSRCKCLLDTIDEAASFLGYDVSESIPLSPSTTALVVGHVECTVIAAQSGSGTQVACEAVESVDASSPFSMGISTFAFSAQLSDFLTLVEATPPPTASVSSTNSFPPTPIPSDSTGQTAAIPSITATTSIGISEFAFDLLGLTFQIFVAICYYTCYIMA